MKVKGMILAVMMMLMWWSGALAGDKVNLFEGDSLIQLNEDQCEVLDYALYLLEENDSVVVLPKEFNLMMGDTIDVKYVGHIDFKSAYFINSSWIQIPINTKTTCGVINSDLIVYKGTSEYKHYVCTPMPINSNHKGTNLFSYIDGEFIVGRVYQNGKYENKILNKKVKKSREAYYEYKKKHAYKPDAPTKRGVYASQLYPYSQMDHIRNQDLPVTPRQGN